MGPLLASGRVVGDEGFSFPFIPGGGEEKRIGKEKRKERVREKEKKEREREKKKDYKK